MEIVKEIDKGTSFSVAVIDAMAEVQMFTPGNLPTIADLSKCFADKILNIKYNVFSEVHLVFDTYLEDSLKGSERVRRESGITPIRYKLEGNTKIDKVQMKKLLSHTQTKDELTEYQLGKYVIDAVTVKNRNATVSFKTQALSTVLNTTDLISTHEEADTKVCCMLFMLHDEAPTAFVYFHLIQMFLSLQFATHPCFQTTPLLSPMVSIVEK